MSGDKLELLNFRATSRSVGTNACEPYFNAGAFRRDYTAAVTGSRKCLADSYELIRRVNKMLDESPFYGVR